jgi:hypothetical protein
LAYLPETHDKLKHCKPAAYHCLLQEHGWNQEKSLKRIFGMSKAANSNTLKFQGWANSHVVGILWGSSDKVMTAMRHDKLCDPSQH